MQIFHLTKKCSTIVFLFLRIALNYKPKKLWHIRVENGFWNRQYSFSWEYDDNDDIDINDMINGSNGEVMNICIPRGTRIHRLIIHTDW